MSYKRFDKDLYNQWDDKAKQVVMTYFASNGIRLKVNPNKYGIDLLDRVGVGVEVEVKEVWEDVFPFETIHIPYRKKKWVNGKNLFVILNRRLSKMAIIDSVDMTNIVTKDTIYTDKEKFYEVSIDKITIVNL